MSCYVVNFVTIVSLPVFQIFRIHSVLQDHDAAVFALYDCVVNSLADVSALFVVSPEPQADSADRSESSDLWDFADPSDPVDPSDPADRPDSSEGSDSAEVVLPVPHCDQVSNCVKKLNGQKYCLLRNVEIIYTILSLRRHEYNKYILRQKKHDWISQLFQCVVK